MRKLVLTFALLMFSVPCTPTPAEAQMGAIIDWIHRLSGPPMVGPAVSGAVPLNDRIRGSMQVAYRFSRDTDGAIEPEGSSVTMLTIRPGVEISLWSVVELNTGVSLNQFGGDINEKFWQASFPLLLQFRVPGSSGRWALRAGFGWEYFPEFGADDFAPLDVNVSMDGGEFAPVSFLGFDWTVGSP
jgi:hypothetical protein